MLNEYELKKIDIIEKVISKEITEPKIEKEHHKYIPPKNYVWRKNMMRNY